MTVKGQSRIRKVVKHMPANPKVMNIEKYVGSWRTQNTQFRRANNLPPIVRV